MKWKAVESFAYVSSRILTGENERPWSFYVPPCTITTGGIQVFEGNQEKRVQTHEKDEKRDKSGEASIPLTKFIRAINPLQTLLVNP